MWMTTGPATNTTRPPRALVSLTRSAIRDTLDSTRRSDDTSFDMNVKSPRSRSRNSGTADHAVARLHLAELPADGNEPIGAAFYNDDGVHTLALDPHPSAVDADVGPQVRRRVEVLGRRPVEICRFEDRVLLLDGPASERHEILQEPLEGLCACRRHLELQSRKIVVRAADFEMQHLELSASLDDRVEDGVEELGVDEVAFSIDDGSVRRGVGHDREGRAIIPSPGIQDASRSCVQNVA